MKPAAPTRQQGFTIIEMMIALTIGLVVVLGLAAAFVNMKNSFTTQDKLTQLQDNQRLAMSMLTDSLQEAGYFPDPVNSDRPGSLPADADTTFGTMDAGQALVGKAASGGKPESLSTRYASSGTDTLMNCVGGTLAAGYVRNVYFVDASTAALVCEYSVNGGAWVTDNGKPFALVSNVQSMSVQYGVDTDGDGNIDRYLAPGAVAAQWSAVRAARITLVFADPVNAGKTLSWVQTVNLMNNR